MHRVETFPPLCQSKLVTLNSCKCLYFVEVVGKAVNKLNENENDTTENEIDDDRHTVVCEQRKGS